MAYRGLSMRPRDVLKLATIVSQGGTWNQARLLAQDWVADSTRSHVVPYYRVHPIANPGFGYLWFTGTIGDKRVVWAWGYAGQFAVIVPALELAIVTAATNPKQAQRAAQDEANMRLVVQVLAAV
jgi:CubicO group peptidase (beta-lactamase class C family)